MNLSARQMSDQQHSFIDLQALWKQGVYTLEECITQLLHAMIRFEQRKRQLDFKLMQYQPPKEELDALPTREIIELQSESNNLLQAMHADPSKAYQAMDFALEHFATLELRFLKMERECEAMLRRLDTTSSHLN